MNETTHAESDDEMKTDTSYSPDEGSDTQSTVISDGQENNKKGIDIMSPSLATISDHAKVSGRNAIYLLAAVIDALELDPDNYNISRLFVETVYLHGQIREDLWSAPSLVVYWDGKLLSDPTG